MVLPSKTESWEGVDGDGRVNLSTEAPVTGWPPRERERACGSEREDERLAMTSGAGLSTSVGERESARGRSRPLAGPRGWANRERAGAWATRLGRTRGREGNRPSSVFDFVFLFQINE
jgi:hypothetical protein